MQKSLLMSLVILVLLSPAQGIAQAKQTTATQPYSMRGLALGSTIAEFKSFTIPNDNQSTDLAAWCSNDKLPEGIRMYDISGDRKLGVVTCNWYSRSSASRYSSLSEHWVDLGAGKGPPVFKFISDGTELRLFEISFFANTEYYRGIYAALSQNYGQPKETTKPFQTRSGAVFESVTSTWSNGSSGITLLSRCREIQRYCLSYNHYRLTKIYQSKADEQSKLEASKI